MARPEKVRLGEILLRQGLLTEDQLKSALEDQKRSGRRLGRVFIDSGYVTEEQICEALARQLRVTFVDLRNAKLNPELVARLPESQARRFRALVLEEAGPAFRVGMADPTDLLAYDELARVLKRDIDVCVVAESQLMAMLDRVYTRSGEISGLAQELGEEMGDNAVDFAAFGTTAAAEDAPVVKLLQTVFEEAVRARASDIHIEPQASKLFIRFRIDGVLHVQTQAEPKIAAPLVLRLKLMSGLDISEKRLPQDGRFHIALRNTQVDVRISTMPTQHGESAVMRLLNQSAGVANLERLGMPAHVLDRMRRIIRRPSGMVLVTGPTGSGKTTTLYAALTELNTPERKIITVEDPVEYRLPGLTQVQVHEKIELTFGRVLRTALRQDPDVILVGEMRDQGTVETGLRAAMTGHLVLSTLHTNDAASTPLRLMDMGAPRFMVAMSLQVVLAQRLVRLLCENCARPHVLEDHERHFLRFELGDRVDQFAFRQATGCDRCNNSGFVGRTAIYEMLEMTRPVVDAASDGDHSTFVAAARKQMGGRTLRRAAVELAAQGRTTVDEAIHATNQLED
ncbi:MAG: Flp pilus assembly complex ATPase component TadA [Betaproteobacteria bacterium]|nr:Flp pilus assembly complex ATPase component TadA [Betaproteobacteria bacterium]